MFISQLVVVGRVFQDAWPHLVVLRAEDVVFGLIGWRFDASQIEQQMGQGVWSPFFGEPAYTMTLAARLIQQTGATPLLVWGERLPRAQGFRVHIQPFPETLSADLDTAVAQINRAMEGLIRQCPQQYLWGYGRYKKPRDAAA